MIRGSSGGEQSVREARRPLLGGHCISPLCLLSNAIPESLDDVYSCTLCTIVETLAGGSILFVSYHHGEHGDRESRPHESLALLVVKLEA